MNCLLHCIYRRTSDPPALDPGVFTLNSGGLAAALSWEAEARTAPSVSSLLAYERAVDAIHATHDLIPFRYGCRIQSEREVMRLLEDRRREYDAMLDRFQGRTEMGIRILWPSSASLPIETARTPGAAYLASLRKRYGAEDNLTQEEDRLANDIAAGLDDCFAEQQREASSSSQGRLVSLYFLLERRAVEEFRRAARAVRPPTGAKLLLSGPWPPYNFAAAGTDPHQPRLEGARNG